MSRVVFMGTPEFAAPCVEVLASHPKVELCAVVCQPDKRHGRHKTPQPPPVKVAAQAHGIEVLQPKRLRRGAFPERLSELAPELIVVTAYGRILPPAILSLPRLGCVNLHASLLPRWRGAAPIQWAIAAGDTQSGVCLMQMDQGLDTGDVLAQATTPIAPDETAQTLHDRLSELSAELLRGRLDDLLAGALRPTPQPQDGITRARILTREDGLIDWGRSAAAIDCQLRGFFPWPGASTTVPGGRALKLFPPTRLGHHRGAPGTILQVGRNAFEVACGAQSALVIREVQLQGKRRMSAGDFLRGFKLRPGDRLGD